MKIRFIWYVLFFISLTVLGVIGYQYLFADLPTLDSLPNRLNAPSTRFVDRHGRLLYEVLPQEGGRHTTVPLEEIPLALRQATIATEDRGFYQHPGVDPFGVLRAAWINLRGGETLAGGSTITQQVARNLLLEESERWQRSPRRKLREALLAWRLTRRFSKDEILALYLNQIYYGGMAYGVEAAAQTFFGLPVGDLDLAQCALLAGLPQAPALYNPFTDPLAAKERQEVVLELMQVSGYISVEERELAEREPLVYAEKPYPIEAPHFVMMARRELDELFSPEQLAGHGGLVVRTTLDLDWQKHADLAIAAQLEKLGRDEAGLGHNVDNAALVAIDPYNGEILSLVGSPDYFDAESSGAVNMAISPRQPGSALKPLVYAAALQPGNPNGGWTAATMLLDVSTTFSTLDGEAYTPANYDLKEHGPVLVREALASSLNIPAVIALDHIGLEKLTNFAQKMGISTLNDPASYDLSLALGGGEVRLLDLTAAYGAFANGGLQVRPRLILTVTNLDGDILYEPPAPQRNRLLDERIAWLITDILADNDARRLGFGQFSVLRLDRPAAVKTGTTSNFHDNWTVGYTPELVVGVWTGNTNYEPMREVDGLSGAAPIWHQFIRAVSAGRPPRDFPQPPGLVQVEICALSGMLPTEACSYRRWESFIEGTQPIQADTIVKEVIVDRYTGLLADGSTPPERQVRQTVLDLPPHAHPWARAQGLTLYRDLLAGGVGDAIPPRLPATIPVSPTLPGPEGTSHLRLVSPPQNGVYRLSPGFESSAQRILLEVVGDSRLREVTIWVDGSMVARIEFAPYRAWWVLSEGDHQAWAEAVLEDGEHVVSNQVSFSVISPGP